MKIYLFLSLSISSFRKKKVSGSELHVLRHMARLALLFVPSPVLGEREPEVEQGMIVARHVPHVHPHLAIVDLPPVATPLPLHPHRMRTPFWEAAGIKGDHPVRFPNRST